MNSSRKSHRSFISGFCRSQEGPQRLVDSSRPLSEASRRLIKDEFGPAQRENDMNTTRVEKYTTSVIPGYGGHTPGVDPESLFGASRTRMSLEGYKLRHGQRTHSARTTNDKGLRYRPGYDVVGYTGFVPGKLADNVYGQTFSRANFASQEVKRIQYKPDLVHQQYVESALQLFDSIRPSHSLGNFPLYSRPENRVVPTN